LDNFKLKIRSIQGYSLGDSDSEIDIICCDIYRISASEWREYHLQSRDNVILKAEIILTLKLKEY
jgi:hypothetical protein